MATHSLGTHPTESRPTKYYFAYGSNLHLKQMRRRCPNNKYIGLARLSNYRWQINERGFANIVAAAGHWVDGLVYEIDSDDEVKLDINEGVAKNAYDKMYLAVNLRRAESSLYRRPTAWIVNKGGPVKASLQTQVGPQRPMRKQEDWNQKVLVYVSLNFCLDSAPREEYVNRINLGVADARALGIEDDYIHNCIRPFIQETPSYNRKTTPGIQKETLKPEDVKQGVCPGAGE